ncbi:hypothetical protein TrRE_jg8464 [Triparma retinervis]|uniref:START domain-containing protein n=1 Tax=Triparma retinervis TaxID=2557542 RepID=A0A9W7ADW9_9STRA|nr:hypothetical protein TrRE_jg8464 [Triparma retinervis]
MEDLLEKISELTNLQKIIGDPFADGTEDMHIILQMPSPFLNRDCVVRRFVEAAEDHCCVITRTITDDRVAREFRGPPFTVRADIHIGGYYLTALSGRRTKVVYIVGADSKGLFALDFIARKGFPKQCSYVVDATKKLGGGRSAMDMGSILESNDEEQGTFEMINMMRGGKGKGLLRNFNNAMERRSREKEDSNNVGIRVSSLRHRHKIINMGFNHNKKQRVGLRQRRWTTP